MAARAGLIAPLGGIIVMVILALTVSPVVGAVVGAVVMAALVPTLVYLQRRRNDSKR